MDERHHHGMLCVVLPCNPSLGQESYGAFRRSYPPVFSDARPVEGVIGAEALLAYQPSQFLSQNALVAGLSAFALKLRQTGLLNDNDGSALAEVPYAGGDTADFAGGEDPPVRGVYKGRSPLCHITAIPGALPPLSSPASTQDPRQGPRLPSLRSRASPA